MAAQKGVETRRACCCEKDESETDEDVQFFDFVRMEVAPFAGLESACVDGCNGYSAEVVDGMSDGGAHAFDESFASFVYGESNEGRLVLGFEDLCFCGCGDAVFEHNALLQFANSLVVYDAFYPGVVNFVDFVSGVGESVGEFSVVGEEEGSGDIHIESSDGENACGDSGYKVDDCFAVVGVFGGGDDALGFVEEDIDFCVGDYRVTIEEDGVDVGIDGLTEVGEFAVDGNAPFLD